MRLIVIISLLLLSDLAYGAGAGSPNDIPWSVIQAQVVNVTLTLGILIYLLKDTVRDLFAGRVDKFDEEFQKAQILKQQAEEKRNSIKDRLEKLKINAEQSIQDSHVQAQNNTKKLLAETDLASKKIITDSEGKVQNQLNKVVGELKLDLLKQSFEKAKNDISNSLGQPDLERLKEEFIKNIQVVQQ